MNNKEILIYYTLAGHAMINGKYFISNTDFTFENNEKCLNIY